VKLAGVYTIVCATTGHRYIGATANLAQRKSAHWSSLRRGLHLNRRLQSICEEYGIGSLRWEVLQAIESGEGLDERLRDAEFRALTTARYEIGDLLIGNPDLVYKSQSRSGRTAQVLLREFKAWCLVRSLNPRDELEKALAAHAEEYAAAERKPGRKPKPCD
jgi:hypothetical protein